MTQRRLVVVGASGAIGSAMMRVAAAAGRLAIGTGRTRTPGGLVAYDMQAAPLRSAVPDLGSRDVVFLLAAHIQPAWIHANPEAARALNLDASRRLADEVLGLGARLVFMSTDLVFDGETGGYTETATPRPLNLYGRLKVAMEEHVLGAAGEGIVARTGWNVGWERGTHCPVAQCYDALLKPGARMAVDNVISVSDVDDTARGLVALAADAPPPHRIYHLVSEPEIGRAEMAGLIRNASRFGADMAFQPIAFAELSYSEPRPVRAFMRSERLPELGVRFAPPTRVIERKVALLDAWRAG